MIAANARFAAVLREIMCETIRASVATQARIIVPVEGRDSYVLGLNKGRHKIGIFNLTPIGGGLTFNINQRERLTQVLGIDSNTGFERVPDSRFYLPKERMPILISMLTALGNFGPDRFFADSGEDLEREIIEELTEEDLTLINGFRKEDVVGIRRSHIVIPPTRPTDPSRMIHPHSPSITSTIQLIHDVELSPLGRSKVMAAALDETSGIYLITQEELLQHEATIRFNGSNITAGIAEVSTALIADQHEIPSFTVINDTP